MSGSYTPRPTAAPHAHHYLHVQHTPTVPSPRAGLATQVAEPPAQGRAAAPPALHGLEPAEPRRAWRPAEGAAPAARARGPPRVRRATARRSLRRQQDEVGAAPCWRGVELGQRQARPGAQEAGGGVGAQRLAAEAYRELHAVAAEEREARRQLPLHLRGRRRREGSSSALWLCAPAASTGPAAPAVPFPRLTLCTLCTLCTLHSALSAPSAPSQALTARMHSCRALLDSFR